MKIGIIGDIHWSRYSSILRLRGEKYSYRLENCIKSINWAEQITSDCSFVVYLGDFFDTSELNAEEITAIKDIQWNTQEHIFLVGNHEMGLNDLSYSSSHLFNYIDIDKGSTVIDTPVKYEWSNCNVHFLPYILEDQRKPFNEYVRKEENKRTIVFSHNDIAGLQLGKYVSKSGFEVEDIQNNCDGFINGHLHNGGEVAEGIINIGNLTGQNFSEDAFKYKHRIAILDTATMDIEYFENPFALNFYKIDSTKQLWDITKLKSNAIITLRCAEESQAYYRELLVSATNVVAHRFITVPKEGTQTSTDSVKELLAVNHIDKFKEYVLNTLGSSDIVLQELEEVSQ